MGKYDNIEEWKQKFRDAKEQGLTALQFRAKHHLTDSNAYSKLRKLINDPELTTFSLVGRKKGPYMGKYQKRLPAEPTYHKMEIEPVSQKKPVFCIIAMYESKEDALRAMGML